MKKLASALLAAVLLLALLPLGAVSVSAATEDGFVYTVKDGKATITDYETYAPWLVVPETLGGYPVTAIGDNAFAQTPVLSTVYLPDSLTTIGNNAFLECYSLTGINIPKNVTSIGDSAFERCVDLTAVVFEGKLKTIGKMAFRYCRSLATLELPSTLTTIGEQAFADCEALTSVTLPDSVKTLSSYAFTDCDALQTVTIGSGLKVIGDSAFLRCRQLTSVYLGKNLTTIGDRAFAECTALQRVVLTDNVTTVNQRAFDCCTALTTLVLNKKVKTIEYMAFYNCGKLAKVYYAGTKAAAQKIAYGDACGVYSTLKWVYSANVSDGHLYTDNCDKSCNLCKATRKAPHSYKKTATKKATLTANGTAKSVCSGCGYTASKTATIYKIASVKLSKTSYAYNGKAQKPTVTVKDSKGNTIASSNYTVTYASGRTNVGTYKVTVKFKGNYSGTKTVTFKIVPKAASVNKLTAGSKKLTVKLNRSLKQSTGYEIQYATSKSFSSAKTKKVSSYKTSTVTLSGLKAKKVYYVRVRTYKKVGDKVYYSSWSSAKSLKTK